MRIYFTIDNSDRVFPVMDWSSDVKPEPGWIIGEIDGPAYEKHGIPRYKAVGEEIRERSAAEIQADIDALPVPEPTQEEQLRADVDYLLMLMGE